MRRLPLATSSLEDLVGGLSNTSKMPWLSWSLPASRCKTGGRLALIPGSVCEECYALKNRYVFGNTQAAMHRRLEALKKPRQWTEAFVALLQGKALRVPPAKRFFRWFDSGDLQSPRHLKAIIEIAERVPTVRFWLPTKEIKMVQGVQPPKNLTIRVSSAMVDTQLPGSYPFPTSAVAHCKALWGWNCPAYSQGGKCLSCRACWFKHFQTIIYPLH